MPLTGFKLFRIMPLTGFRLFRIMPLTGFRLLRITPLTGFRLFRKKIFRATPGNPREDFSIFAWPKAVTYGLAGVCKRLSPRE